MIDRRDSPWYPAMPLFSPERAKEWKPVSAQVRCELEQFVADRAMSQCAADAPRLTEIANYLVNLNRPEEALGVVERALDVDPEHVEALRTGGIVPRGRNRYGEALDCYDRAIAVSPAD